MRAWSSDWPGSRTERIVGPIGRVYDGLVGIVHVEVCGRCENTARRSNRPTATWSLRIPAEPGMFASRCVVIDSLTTNGGRNGRFSGRPTIPAPHGAKGSVQPQNTPPVPLANLVQPSTASPSRFASENRSASSAADNRSASVCTDQAASKRLGSGSASTPLSPISAGGAPFPLVGASE